LGERLGESLEILEQFRRQLDSRKASLLMVVPHFENAHIKLHENRIKWVSQFDWIRAILSNLIRRLVA
jgi:hypothetical protein